jgi:hypothetical protein
MLGSNIRESSRVVSKQSLAKLLMLISKINSIKDLQRQKIPHESAVPHTGKY